MLHKPPGVAFIDKPRLNKTAYMLADCLFVSIDRCHNILQYYPIVFVYKEQELDPSVVRNTLKMPL